MNEPADEQVRNNAASRDRWDLYRPHRDRVTDLLRPDRAAGPSRLCVLGAGNCNDLDLPGLLAAHAEVHLVDLDGDALAAGVARQGLQGHPAVRRHGGIDLTGMLDTVAGWSPGSAIRDADLAACVEAPARQVLPALPGPFDRVVSTCLLSQLINAVVRTAGEQHPRFLPALQAVRTGHLRLLAGLVAPGGTGVLVTDVVSSDSFAALPSIPEDQLPAALAGLVRAGNFFHGINPAVLDAFFRTDPVVAPQVAGVRWSRPWLWDFGPRVYLTCAVTFHRRPAAAPGAG
jgi:hypothetical protein